MDEQNEPFIEAIKQANPAQFPDFTDVNQALKAVSEQPISHLWRQRGPELVCTSCNHEHGQWVGMDKLLTGFDDKGLPILKDR